MKWFKRKPKTLHHELKDIGLTPTVTKFYRAVECKHCGKQFIMDVFGGWSIEWKFRELGGNESLSKDELLPAIKEYYRVSLEGWTQLGFNDVCEKGLKLDRRASE